MGLSLRVENELVRKGLAEFLGTFMVIALGCGANAQYTLGRGLYGDWLAMCWGWGIAIAMGVWICGGVSGGHLNPAVSLAMSVLGKLPWKMFIVYSLMQYLGAIVASACVFGVYYDAIVAYGNGTLVKDVTGPYATAGIWGTYPAAYIDGASAFADLMFGAFLLVLGVMAITDKNNMTPPQGLVPISVGLLVIAIGLSYGMNCGFALNPARDFGPRLFTAMAGYGSEVFTAPDDAYDYWWKPIVATHIGAIAGAFTYIIFVGGHIVEDKEIELKSPSLPTADTAGKVNNAYSTEITLEKF